jgi:hypothetical protein
MPAGASRQSRDGVDHLFRHRSVSPYLAPQRGCLITGNPVGLVPVLLDLGETPDHDFRHHRLAGTHAAH